MRILPENRGGWKRMITLITFVLLSFAAAYLVVVVMPGKSHQGSPPNLNEKQKASAHRLEATVNRLASVIGERNVFRPAELGAALSFLREEFVGLGLPARRQVFMADGREVANLEVIIEGGDPEMGCLVIGAHYDSLKGTPGADDNATGAAALLELARLLRDQQWRGDLRLVFFVNEEPPFFQTELMGSVVYARSLAAQGVTVRGMLALESMGYFDSAAGSQRYPFPFNLCYPDRGNFIGFVGNVSSRSLVRRAVRSFRSNAAFPSEGIAAPSFIPGIGWSDHWAFWKFGYPARMITDTAPFRNPNYHRGTDSIETLDFLALARIVHGLVAVINDLDTQ